MKVRDRMTILLIGKDMFDKVQKISQDVDRVKTPSPDSWTSDDEETNFVPFQAPKDSEIELLYLYCALGRIACETMAKDVLNRWFEFNTDEVVDQASETKESEKEDLGSDQEEEEPIQAIQEEKEEPKPQEENIYDKKYQKMLREVSTPQNPDWGYRELKQQALTWEFLNGYAIIATVPANGDIAIEEETENKHTEYDWIVFSKQHVQEQIFDWENRLYSNKRASLLPDAFRIQLKTTMGFLIDHIIPIENCIIYNFRPQLDSWEGMSKVMPIYSSLVYIENSLFGNSEAYWRHGVGNFVFEWPKTEDLAALKVEFGSIGSKKMTHLHRSDRTLQERIFNASLSGTIADATPIIKQCIDFVCGYLECPSATLFGSPQGALSSSWIQDINYESTLQNRQEQATPNLKKFLKMAFNLEDQDITWNAGKIIDESMRADARIKQLEYYTLNEVREMDELEPLPGGDVLLKEYISKHAGTGIGISASFTNKGRKSETGKESGTPDKPIDKKGEKIEDKIKS